MIDLFCISINSNSISKRMQLEILPGKILVQKDYLCQMDSCCIPLIATRAMIYEASKISVNVETSSAGKRFKKYIAQLFVKLW